MDIEFRSGSFWVVLLFTLFIIVRYVPNVCRFCDVSSSLPIHLFGNMSRGPEESNATMLDSFCL
jgi:hypothetical protein